MNYVEELRNRIIETGALTPVLAFAAGGAGVSTFFGVRALVGGSGVEGIVVAVVTAGVVTAALFFVWHTLIKIVPLLESTARRACGIGLALVVSLVTILTSSWFIATSIGGTRAVQAYMNSSVSSAHTEIGHAVQNFASEQSLIEVIRRLAAGWRAQANSEQKTGAISGRSGAGPIVSTLNGAAADLENLAAAMQQAKQEFQGLQEQAEKMLAELSKIANGADADSITSQQRFTAMHGQLFQKVQQMDRLSMIAQVRNGGGILVIKTTTGGSIGEDLGRIQVSLDKQTRELHDAVGRIEASRREVKANPYVPTNKGIATWEFASAVPGAWIVGVAIDFFPLLALLLLMLGHSETRKPHVERTPFSVVAGGREATRAG